MNFRETKIAGCYVVELDPIKDERGFFSRLYCEDEFRTNNLEPSIAQVNTGMSVKAGTLRGMHYQAAPSQDTKLVKCLAGAVYDVCLDLREGSPTYCQWFAVDLSAANRKMLYLPAGTAHGYQALTDDAEIMYFTNQRYSPERSTGVRYNDPCFKINWPLAVTAISEADTTWPDFRALKRMDYEEEDK